MKLGLYTVHGEIGRGGMGVVYRAVDPSGREVAVKLLQARRDALPRFSREARLQQQLGENEGFVPLLDMGVSPHGPYLVMPLLDSGTLRDRLATRAQLEITEAVDLVHSLAKGLGHAHALGIVHRDVKPDNVLFSRHGRPLLADLGLAKHFRHDLEGGSQSFALSRPGQARGTFGYMAPEQLRDAAQSGPPADVYALGAVLYEVVTGQPAFQAATFVELMSKVAEGRVRHPRTLRRDCPNWLSNVIAKALAVDPNKRYPDASALAAALSEPPRSGNTVRALGAVASLAAVAMALAVWAFLERSQPDLPSRPPPPPNVVEPPAWAALPELYRELGKVEQGPRLVAVWGHLRETAPVLALADHAGSALALDSSGMRLWSPRSAEPLLIGSPPPGERFYAGSLLPSLGRALTSSNSLLGWNLDEATPLVQIPLEAPSPAVALSPNGLRGVLALGGNLFRFSVGRGIPAGAAPLSAQHPTPITSVAAASNQDYLSASSDLVVLHSIRGTHKIPHPSEPISVAFLEPGSLPLTLDASGAVRGFEGQALSELVPAPVDLRDELGPAIGLAASAEGRCLAVGHLNGTRLLQLGPGGWQEQARVILPAGGGRLAAVALAPRSSSLLIGTSRGAVLRFSLEDAEPPAKGLPTWAALAEAGAGRARLAGAAENLCGLPSGDVLSLGSHGWVSQWSSDDGQLKREFYVGTPVFGCQLRGVDQLITLGGGRCLRVWDLGQDPPLELQRIGVEGLPLHFDVGAQGRYAVVGDLDGFVTYLDLTQRKRLGNYQAPRELAAVACLDDNRIALGLKGKVLILDPLTGKELEDPRLVGGGQVTALERLSSTTFLAGTDKGAILSFERGRPTPQWITMLGGRSVRSLTQDGDHVLVGMRRGHLMSLRLSDGGTRWETDSPAGPQVVSASLGDGRGMAGGTLRALSVFDTATGQPLWEPFPGHLGEADALSFVPGGLLSVGTDGARSWRLEGSTLSAGYTVPMIYNLSAATASDGTVLSEELLEPMKPREELKLALKAHLAPPREPLTVDFSDYREIGLSPDGKRAYTFASDPDRAAMFDLGKNAQLLSIYTLGGRFQAQAFSPDSQQVAYALGSKLSLRVPPKDDLAWRIDGRADTLTFLPAADGTLHLLCGSNLGGLQLRALEDGTLLRSFAPEAKVRHVVAVGPDRFVTLSPDDTLLAWDLAASSTPIAELVLGDPSDHPVALTAELATQRVAVGTAKGRVAIFRWGG